MAYEQFSNFGQTSLSGGISSGSTTLTVNSVTNFPTGGNFRIVIDSEIMLVTAVAGSTFTVSRGAEGTTAVSHAGSAAVTQVGTSAGMAQYRADGQPSFGLYASAPTSPAPPTGSLYYATDTPVTRRWSGSAWVDVAVQGTAFANPAQNTAFSWANQASATVSTNFGGYLLSSPSIGSTATPSLNIYEQTFTKTQTLICLCCLIGISSNQQYFNIGFSMRSPANTTKVYTIGLSTGASFSTDQWTSPTVYSGTAFTGINYNFQNYPTGYLWWKRVFTTTTEAWYVSRNALVWELVTRGDLNVAGFLGFDATTIGFFASNQTPTTLLGAPTPNIGVHMLSWLVQ